MPWLSPSSLFDHPVTHPKRIGSAWVANTLYLTPVFQHRNPCPSCKALLCIKTRPFTDQIVVINIKSTILFLFVTCMFVLPFFLFFFLQHFPWMLNHCLSGSDKLRANMISGNNSWKWINQLWCNWLELVLTGLEFLEWGSLDFITVTVTRTVEVDLF